MRRVLSRAAVVLGGVAAGWLLSTAGASADPDHLDQDRSEVVRSTVDVLGGPGRLAGAVEAVLPEPPATPAELGQVGRELHGAVRQTTGHPSPPAETSTKDDGEDTSSASPQLPTNDDHGNPLLVVPAPVRDVQSSTGSPATAHLADHHRQPVSEPARRVAPSDAPELPGLPTQPLPVAP
ncbi:MAG: hypothetical protein ABW215_00220, partial [Kibdelosporangium sp.]